MAKNVSGIPDIWGFQLEVSFRIGSDFKDYLFKYRGSIARNHGGVKCWWPHGEITILGFTMGAGFIYKFNSRVKL